MVGVGGTSADVFSQLLRDDLSDREGKWKVKLTECKRRKRKLNVDIGADSVKACHFET